MERDRQSDREGQKSKGGIERPDKHLVKEENYEGIHGLRTIRTKRGGKVVEERSHYQFFAISLSMMLICS